MEERRTNYSFIESSASGNRKKLSDGGVMRLVTLSFV